MRLGNKLNVRRLVGILFLLFTLVFYSGNGLAASWQQNSTAGMSTEYDSNPTLSPAYPGSVLRALFDPNYTLIGRVGVNELRSSFAIHMERSSNVYLSEDRNDPRVFLDWKHPSETGEFGISATYNQMATRLAEGDISGPGYIPSTRVSRLMSGRWNSSLSERSTLSANASYEGVFYMGGTYTDYITRSGDIMFKYDWSELNAASLKITHSDYAPAAGDLPSNTTNYVVAWDWRASDELEGNLQVGKYMISEITNTTTGRQFSASIRYAGQRARFGLNAGRQVIPSGYGGFVLVDQANANWSYALSDHSTAGIDLIWQRNQYAIKTINRNPGAWLQNELNPFWNLRTYYLHRTSEESGISSASSNIIGISLVYTNDDF